MIGFPVGHMTLEQQNVLVEGPVQSQLAHQLMQGTDSTAADGPGSFGNLVVDVGVFEHGFGLVLILLSHQTGFKILLVTKADFVVSFIHLKCAPFGCISNIQVPITTNNDTHFRHICNFS
jgi:hypothetical protein